MENSHRIQAVTEMVAFHRSIMEPQKEKYKYNFKNFSSGRFSPPSDNDVLSKDMRSFPVLGSTSDF